MEDVLTAYTVRYRMQYHAIPVKLDDKLYNLARRVIAGDGRPTAAQRELFAEFQADYAAVRQDMRTVLTDDLAAFNRSLAAAGLDRIETPPHLERLGRTNR